jgi:hypothetical protein
LSKTLLKKPWLDTMQEHYARLREAARHTNAHFDVSGLCGEWPQRMAQLIARGGDKLSK